MPLSELFECRADFGPEGSLDDLLNVVPAKWVVYLFAAEADEPIQLLCVKNLRASLKRRLGGEEVVGPARKLDYRQLARRIHWRRVDSAFEADLFYLEIARQVFPGSYRGMLGFEPAWFVQVDPAERFPRYVKTTDPNRPGIVIGPFNDKRAAARFVELVEDAFDLCRYHNILIESPHGRACAYKEMGKCPAPCDGGISLEQYRGMVDWSARTAVAPEAFVAGHTRRMMAAAAGLQFEAAARIKLYIEQISRLGQGAFRYARPLADFQFLSLQHGPRAGTARIFLIQWGGVTQPVSFLSEPKISSDLLRSLAAPSPWLALDEPAIERIGIVSNHLLRSRRGGGVFIPLSELDDRSLAEAYRGLQKQNIAAASEEEGVVKELVQL